MGRWVSGKKLHFHDMPKHGENSKKGCFWECVCGTVFKVVEEAWDEPCHWWKYEWKEV